MEKQNTANAKFLERFHMHQEEMDAMRGGLKTLYQGLNLQGTASTKISIALQILSETIHVNTQLQEAISTAKEILAKSDFDLLHRQSISPNALGDITDKIYLQRRNSTPVFSRSEIDQYYRLKLAHIWSEWRLTVIAATVRIALVDILDLSEVNIPAGVFLHPAVGWG